MNTSEGRRKLLNRMIGKQVPRLWCPPLSHYTPKGEVDHDRMTAHWSFMAPNVRGFLVPGSTGDGWEMDTSEVRVVIDFALELAEKLNVNLLLGVLKENIQATFQVIMEMLAILKRNSGEDDSIEAMKSSKVCGFTICAPRGSEISQNKMESDLISVLELGLPTVLYQLPQVTENEMSPSLVKRLTDRYANLLLLKDSSGGDRVALESDNVNGLFLLRGAEGHYARWLKESGGPYNGLLLSTANCFPRELRKIIDFLEKGCGDDAIDLSDRLTQVFEKVFDLVSDIPDGNTFANANKAMDHYMAFGADARTTLPPRLHAGTLIPEDVILGVGEVLESSHLIPEKGYLNQ